jgi:hypothetical protein
MEVESWQVALRSVGVQASESTVYLWRQKWRKGGEAAMTDRRHGRRCKMNDRLRPWSNPAFALDHYPGARTYATACFSDMACPTGQVDLSTISSKVYQENARFACPICPCVILYNIVHIVLTFQ